MPTKQTTNAAGERGQTLVLMVVFMVVLLGCAALAIDVGNWWLQKSELQNNADAAALAGASNLPAGWPVAELAAQSYYAKNGQSSDTVTYQNTTDSVSGDSVTVTATRTVPTWFASVLGIGSATISATAQATVESIDQASGPGIMPWGVLQNTYVPGQPYTIYTTNVSNANNGAINIPYDSSSSCPVPSGSAIYRNLIAGSLTPCAVSVNETVTTDPGNNSGPTAQGLTSRISDWESLSQIVDLTTTPATVKDSSSPQLVLVPVLTNQDGQSAWPNGTSSPMTVVGFAWFVITGCGTSGLPSACSNSSDGKQVDGTFVTLDSSATVGTGGKYQPSSGSAYMAALTK